jgi:hypothetical protein
MLGFLRLFKVEMVKVLKDEFSFDNLDIFGDSIYLFNNFNE